MIELDEISFKPVIAEPYHYYPSGDPITSVSDLHAKVKELQCELKPHCHLWEKDERHNLHYGIYFRGLCDCKHKLVPPIGRKNYNELEEINHISRFRRRAYYHQQRILDIWEAMFLGRHFGLRTRLLDWTSGMHVALYFACKDYFDKINKGKIIKDGALYALVRQPGEDYDLNVFHQSPIKEGQSVGESQFVIKGVKLIYPFHVSQRMTAQASIFTIQDDPQKALEEYPYREYCRENYDIFHIRKWKVPKDKKKCIIKELEDIGVNGQTLFPGLQGLAEGIEQIENVRRHR